MLLYVILRLYCQYINASIVIPPQRQHYHHTVPVAMCAYSFVHTLVNALVLQGKTPPAQVAAGGDDHDCKWSIFDIVGGRKNTSCFIEEVAS